MHIKLNKKVENKNNIQLYSKTKENNFKKNSSCRKVALK